jgi:hypothetical protein
MLIVVVISRGNTRQLIQQIALLYNVCSRINISTVRIPLPSVEQRADQTNLAVSHCYFFCVLTGMTTAQKTSIAFFTFSFRFCSCGFCLYVIFFAESFHSFSVQHFPPDLPCVSSILLWHNTFVISYLKGSFNISFFLVLRYSVITFWFCSTKQMTQVQSVYTVLSCPASHLYNSDL